MKEYRIGEIIKQRRIELGLTQDELCEGICEASTMSRIENGKQAPSKTKLNVLMQRLGLPDDRYYAFLSDNEVKIADLQKEIVSCNIFKDAAKGLEAIARLEQIAEEDDRSVQQFILRSRAILGKLEGGSVVEYSLQEKKEFLLQAIRLTSPKFHIDEIKNGLYSIDEVKIINQIAQLYSSSGDHEKTIVIYRQLLEYIENHFKNILQSSGLLPLVAYNYARELDLLERYQEAIDIAEMGRKACVKYGQYRTLPSTLAIMAECYHFLNNDERSKELYRQAYYLHQAIDNERGVQLVESEMQRYFGKNILFER